MSSRLLAVIRNGALAPIEHQAAGLHDSAAEQRTLGALCVISARSPQLALRLADSLGLWDPLAFDNELRASIFDSMIALFEQGRTADVAAIHQHLPQVTPEMIERELQNPGAIEDAESTFETSARVLNDLRIRRLGVLVGWELANDSCNLATREPLRILRRFAEVMSNVVRIQEEGDALDKKRADRPKQEVTP